MALELTGKLLQKLPVQSGQSAKGAWSKQEFVLETQENYPRKVCASVWGADKVNELASISEGTLIKVSFNVESRQFNERWYTDIRAWRIERTGIQDATGNPSAHDPVPYSDPGYIETTSEIDDLPF
jgi:hypothetical protein